MATAQAPSGRRIWQAVREELTLNLYPLPFSTLAPTVYHVYLHPEDFAGIEGVVPRIVEQIRQALGDEVARMNAGAARPVKALVSRLLDREQLPPIEIPATGWEVHLRADTNAELARGQIGIVSTLALPAPPEYGGTPTTRIVRSVVGTGGRSSSVADVPQGAADALADGSRRETRPTEGRGPRDRARITYADDQGTHTFVMRKDAVSIGRGGSAVWVDVQVATGSRVSREHARLRADGDGRFYIQDVSLWGTTVDDVPIPSAIKGPEGVAEPGAEHRLAPRARIGLAGAITLDFEAL